MKNHVFRHSALKRVEGSLSYGKSMNAIWFFKGVVRYFFFCILFYFILMYNILRLFCENLKAIEVKLTEIYTCKSPPYGEDCGRNDQLPDNL